MLFKDVAETIATLIDLSCNNNVDLDYLNLIKDTLMSNISGYWKQIKHLVIKISEFLHMLERKKCFVKSRKKNRKIYCY